jgi:K(+)-stimulated pyrophosphate-energized sodium pump
MDLLWWIAPISAVLALCVALFLAITILRKSEGTEKMVQIASWVRQGAVAYLRRQYMGVSVFFLVMFCVLLFMAFKNYFTIFVPFAFLTGGFFSALAGYVGMRIATYSSARTANAARQGLNPALQIAFSSGTVMGLTVVGFNLLYLSLWFLFLNRYYSMHALPAGADKLSVITTILLCASMGASSQALFARVGGGIFTKAADVGADLVGKVEQGIPEDDPRNPAVIADNVGDNVGDVAGMGADLYESYSSSIVATQALALAAGLGLSGVMFPMIIAGAGILASIIGRLFVRARNEASQAVLLSALRRGVNVTAILVAVAAFFIARYILGMQYIGIYFAILSGLIAGVLIGFCTEVFTSSNYSFTRTISESSLTGPATVIISGMSVGMLSTFVPVLVVVIALLLSYYLSGGASNMNLGLYGIAISGVGMLSTLGITLATDAYGPVADNAGGNAEMSGLPKEVRERTDALDALGNTTAATGKGFAIASAALTALALIAAYNDQIRRLGVSLDLRLTNPKMLGGLFVGAMAAYFFAALLMRAVGKAAAEIVVEVRRQFKEIKGIMEGTAQADYSRCVDIVTRAAQREMIFPSLIAIFTPLVVGALIGVDAVVGLLTGATVSGFILAVMMANSGGAWDNAKKFIEAGNFGGKGSLSHKAAVVGDTVGDPFKDTAGPSLNILIKLMSMVSIVFAALIVRYTLFKL